MALRSEQMTSKNKVSELIFWGNVSNNDRWPGACSFDSTRRLLCQWVLHCGFRISVAHTTRHCSACLFLPCMKLPGELILPLTLMSGWKVTVTMRSQDLCSVCIMASLTAHAFPVSASASFVCNLMVRMLWVSLKSILHHLRDYRNNFLDITRTHHPVLYKCWKY